MVLGFLGIPWESIVLPYDDEKTPIKLVGKKMLPILTFKDGRHMGESLDIIEALDTDNKLSTDTYKNDTDFINFLNNIGKDLSALCMPYWIYTREFNDTSRMYFQKKKEAKYGPFSKLLSKKDDYILNVNVCLNDFEKYLMPFYKDQKISLCDILLASHLWGAYVVSEFQFSPKMHGYLQKIKTLCSLNQDHFAVTNILRK